MKTQVLTKGKHQFRFHVDGNRAVINTSTGGVRRVTRRQAARMWAHLCNAHGFKQTT